MNIYQVKTIIAICLLENFFLQTNCSFLNKKMNFDGNVLTVNSKHVINIPFNLHLFLEQITNTTSDKLHP